MRDPAYAAFSALDPFFDIVRQGLAGLVDGDHYFDTIAPDCPTDSLQHTRITRRRPDRSLAGQSDAIVINSQCPNHCRFFLHGLPGCCQHAGPDGPGIVCLTLAKWETVSDQFGGYRRCCSPRTTGHGQGLSCARARCTVRMSSCASFFSSKAKKAFRGGGRPLG